MSEGFEQFWNGLYKDRNPILVTTLISFVVHEVAFFGRYLPWLACDFIPALQKYKIQPTKVNSPELMKKCLKVVLLNHFFIQLPMQLGFHPIAEYLGMTITGGVFPSVFTMMFQIALFLVFEDFVQYFAHRALHHPLIYKHIHKLHHEYTAPFGIAAEYAHPAETLILGSGTIGGPLLYVYFTGDLHLATVLLWCVLRVFQAIDSHSGYDFPINLRNWIPFWAGSDFHDHHHLVFLGNYSSSFRFWDWVCGTDKRYNAYKADKLKKQALAASQHIRESSLAFKEE